MFATWKYTVRRLLVSTMCWGGVLSGAAFLLVLSFDHMIQENKQLLIDLIANLPAPLRALAGDADQFVTPKGFLDAKFFIQSGLLLCIYAVFSGSGLLASDEEKGRLDLLASYPVSRRGLFWGRTFALLTSLVTIVFLAWLGLASSLAFTEVDVSPYALGLGCLTLYAVTVAYMGKALLLSLLLPSRMVAVGAAGLLLFISFLLALLAPAIDFVRPAHVLFPFCYYQGGKAMGQLDIGALMVLVILAMIELLAAWWLFERRDIRVMGEGVLRLRKTAIGLVTCLAVYLAILGPAAAWIGFDPPRTSPANLIEDVPTPFKGLMPDP